MLNDEIVSHKSSIIYLSILLRSIAKKVYNVKEDSSEDHEIPLLSPSVKKGFTKAWLIEDDPKDLPEDRLIEYVSHALKMFKFHSSYSRVTKEAEHASKAIFRLLEDKTPTYQEKIIKLASEGI